MAQQTAYICYGDTQIAEDTWSMFGLDLLILQAINQRRGCLSAISLLSHY